MLKKRTDGVVVYSKRIPRSGKVSVGVWLADRIPPAARAELMRLNETAGFGHVGVHTNSRGTIVKYIGPAASKESETHLTPQQIAVRLGRAVKAILGVEPTLRQLRNLWLVEHALA